MEGDNWLQIALSGLATAGIGVGGYLKSVISSGDRALGVRIDKVETDFARKDMLETAIETLQTGQDETRNDLRITNEKLDSVARDVNILIGKFDAHFNVQSSR